MTALAVVCARRGSAGVKDKNVRPIAGVPLVIYTIDEAIASEAVSAVVVSTDDERIAHMADALNVECLRRPPELCAADAHIAGALRHAYAALLERGRRYDVVVCLYANVPVRAEKSIESVVDAVCGGATGAITVAPVGKHHPGWMVTVASDGALATYAPGAGYRRQDLPPLYVADGAAFAVRADVLVGPPRGEGLYAFLGERVVGVINPRGATVDVDDEADFEHATYRIVTAGMKMKVVERLDAERGI